MVDTKESSVLFSLRELMTLEEDRIRTEDAEKRRLAEEMRHRHEEELRRARAEEEARIAAADEAQRAEERRRIAEAERIRRERDEGELRVRLEAEARTHQLEQERLLAHEQHLATLAAQQQRGIGAGTLVGVVVAVLALGGSGVWFGVMRPAHDRALQEAAQRDRETANLRATHDAEVAEQAATRARLEGEARVARERADAAERARLLEAQHPPVVQLPAQHPTSRPHPPTTHPRHPPTDPLDPFSGTLL